MGMLCFYGFIISGIVVIVSDPDKIGIGGGLLGGAGFMFLIQMCLINRSETYKFCGNVIKTS